MTINVRNLEYMIRRLRSSNIIELHDLAGKLLKECQPHVPSLLKYQDSIDYIKLGYANVLLSVDCCDFSSCGCRSRGHIYFKDPGISFCSCSSPFTGFYPPDFLTYRNLINPTVFNIMSVNTRITNQLKFNVYESILKYVTVHDSLPREFEFVDFTFEVLVSASCYAQLKRHRMSSQVRSCYIETFNYIPSVFMKVDLVHDFEDLMEKVRLLYCKVLDKFGFSIASYVLTQSNMRKVLIKMNARDLYHFFSLRCDKHAGHEIRTLATKMLEVCKEKEPMLFMLACGKDGFEKTKEELFKE
jgi:thymidylate synthase ThyX